MNSNCAAVISGASGVDLCQSYKELQTLTVSVMEITSVKKVLMYRDLFKARWHVKQIKDKTKKITNK